MMMMMMMMMIGFLESGTGLLSVAVQLGRNEEPGGDGSPTNESQVRYCFSQCYSRNCVLVERSRGRPNHNVFGILSI